MSHCITHASRAERRDLVRIGRCVLGAAGDVYHVSTLTGQGERGAPTQVGADPHSEDVDTQGGDPGNQLAQVEAAADQGGGDRGYAWRKSQTTRPSHAAPITQGNQTA